VNITIKREPDIMREHGTKTEPDIEMERVVKREPADYIDLGPATKDE
jgi:hypothetical protein